MKNRIAIIIVSVIGSVLLLGLIIGGFTISQTNSINTSYQNIEKARSQVTNVEQRRFDLIPNVTAAVKGNMKHESKVFIEVAKARNNVSNAKTDKEKLAANAQLDKSTNLLINAVHENYPNLQSNDQVNNLITELEGCENRISVERRNYNQAVEVYNLKLTNFPSSLFANGRKPALYFNTNDNVKSAPKVNLNE